MPWMLQPKNYTQIARPNLYNVAYRRVGAYKGMGRLHPTNYLEIGPRPNRIGNTTGQYNTLSGQLSLFPPSLRGLGQDPTAPAWYNVGYTGGGPDSSTTTISLPGFPSGLPTQTSPTPGSPVPTTTSNFGQWFQQNGIYVAVGVGVLALLLAAGARR